MYTGLLRIFFNPVNTHECMEGEFELVPLANITVQKNNVRTHEFGQGKEDLAENIRANGLIHPITTYYDSGESGYVVLTGQRRLNAYHYLDEKYPHKGFDKILCRIIPEPATDKEKKSLSLAENITQLPMTNSDLVRAVTDLYNTYGEYEIVQEKFGLSKNLVDTYVRISRLPERLKTAIHEGEIHHKPKTAERAALRAVDALHYTKDGQIPAETVLELAKEMAKPETSTSDLANEAKRGGSVHEMVQRVATRPKSKLPIRLDKVVAEKLRRVSEASGDSELDRATQYVTDCTERDYSQLGD